MKTDGEFVSEHLMELITQQNLTINRVATLAGLNQSTVNAMFEGEVSAQQLLQSVRYVAPSVSAFTTSSTSRLTTRWKNNFHRLLT